MDLNHFKNFRKVLVPGGDSLGRSSIMSPRFDQPTYLSFKLEFGIDDDRHNDAANQGLVNYDIMPHPLFGRKGNDKITDRQKYSAIDYLLDANEFTRAEMLKEFIQQFNRLQIYFPWYFQSIEGIGDILKINPIYGMRVPSDKRLLITMMEGIDQRVTHLLNLYRKIVWDDTYQRWVLPDMMRYFTLNIYIAEFRTFHTPNNLSGYGSYDKNDNRGDKSELYLNILDDVLPVLNIKCEMCEFDLENIEYEHMGNLNIIENPTEAKIKFGIKVGKIYEEQIYPTFTNMFLIDKNINGFDRAKSTVITGATSSDVAASNLGVRTGDTILSESFNSTTASNHNNNLTIYNPKTKLIIAQGQQHTSEDSLHISGSSYQQMTNSKSLFGANAAGPDGKFGTEDDNIVQVDPTDPQTWFGNTVNWGKSYGMNILETFVDKAKMTPIPGLGISFNEAKSALESKNIITALGLIRKGVDEVARSYIQPSELLGNDIADTLFRDYLQGIVNSRATSETEMVLQAAANSALNDDGTWEKIKDFSKATDLVGSGMLEGNEINSLNIINSAISYSDIVSAATLGDNSFATDLVGPGENNIPLVMQHEPIILEGVPTSKATSNILQ